MRFSKLFTKTLKSAPKEADNISAKLLYRANFVDKLAAGIFSYLPLGWKMHKNIENIIREEMDALGGQEISLPVLQPETIWQETDRWDKMDPPLFKLKDRHGKNYCLGPTHEEVVTKIVRGRVNSYKDLPFMVYQIQDKFRNELRSSGGLLRTREFTMKDAYSFHAGRDDLRKYYKRVSDSYKRIFQRCGLEVVVTKADSGSIGGEVSHEFMTLCKRGEDKIAICDSCQFAANVDVLEKNVDKCPECGRKLRQELAIENGHTFDLGTLYSEKMGARFTDKDGKEKPFVMGCYGIGVGRLMASILEVHHDKAGMILPKEVAPYQIHLLTLGEDRRVKRQAEKIYKELTNSGIEVLYDDREESAGVKLSDADLLGMPIRAIVSEKTIAKNKIELKKRKEKETKLVSLNELKKLD